MNTPTTPKSVTQSSKQIVIRCNDELCTVSSGTSIADFLTLRSIHNISGIALAVDGIVVVREQWSMTELKENQDVLIITAAQGG